MKEGKHQVVLNNKAVKERFANFVSGEMVDVVVIDRKSGLCEVVGKGRYSARLLKGILSPIKEEEKV